MSSNNKALKIGLIIGSTRVARIGPQVAQFILDVLKNTGDADLQSQTDIRVIDIKDFDLPMFDEPGLMNRITKTEQYKHEHTRTWSRHIIGFDAFVFISAQRNWGIPAELKNSIDFLFHEWKGKPAMIVTYGGHGGEQAAAQIKIVLGAIGMRVVERMVNMKFPSKDYLDKGLYGLDMGLDANSNEATWSQYRPDIADVFWNDMVKKMLLAPKTGTE